MHLQDYNEMVLRLVTLPNVILAWCEYSVLRLDWALQNASRAHSYSLCERRYVSRGGGIPRLSCVYATFYDGRGRPRDRSPASGPDTARRTPPHSCTYLRLPIVSPHLRHPPQVLLWVMGVVRRSGCRGAVRPHPHIRDDLSARESPLARQPPAARDQTFHPQTGRLS